VRQESLSTAINGISSAKHNPLARYLYANLCKNLDLDLQQINRLDLKPDSLKISSIKTWSRSACEYPSSAISCKVVTPSLANETEQFLVAVSMFSI
jgi:hypothetical protein